MFELAGLLENYVYIKVYNYVYVVRFVECFCLYVMAVYGKIRIMHQNSRGTKSISRRNSKCGSS